MQVRLKGVNVRQVEMQVGWGNIRASERVKMHTMRRYGSCQEAFTAEYRATCNYHMSSKKQGGSLSFKII